MVQLVELVMHVMEYVIWRNSTCDTIFKFVLQVTELVIKLTEYTIQVTELRDIHYLTCDLHY